MILTMTGAKIAILIACSILSLVGVHALTSKSDR